MRGGGYSLSVIIFFLISGFWVTKSYCSSASIKSYFAKRAKKILPLYYLVVFVFAFFAFFFTSLSAKEYFMSKGFIKYVICNVLTLNFACPSLPGAFGGNAVNGSLWTIKVELGFYILLPVILWLMKKICFNEQEKQTKKMNVFLGVIYAFSTIIACVIQLFIKKFNLHHSLNNQLPTFMPFFIAGMFFYFNYDFCFKNQYKMIIPAVIVFAAQKFIYLDFLLPLAVMQIVFFLAFNLKPFNNFGRQTDYSYAMYLVHFPIMNMLKSTNAFDTYPYFSMLCVVAFSFMLAYLMENFIQKKIK